MTSRQINYFIQRNLLRGPLSWILPALIFWLSFYEPNMPWYAVLGGYFGTMLVYFIGLGFIRGFFIGR